MVTRCKFKCSGVTLHEGGQKSVEMRPVYSTKEGSENKKFWEASPSGEFRLNWLNPNVSFEPGKEYYLDISEAPKEE